MKPSATSSGPPGLGTTATRKATNHSIILFYIYLLYMLKDAGQVTAQVSRLKKDKVEGGGRIVRETPITVDGVMGDDSTYSGKGTPFFLILFVVAALPR